MSQELLKKKKKMSIHIYIYILHIIIYILNNLSFNELNLELRKIYKLRQTNHTYSYTDTRHVTEILK